MKRIWLRLVGILCIAVIGLFLILPVLPERPRVQRTQCLSNVKQLGVALAAYSDDWHGHYPVVSWQTSIGKYVKDQSIHDCPEVLARGGKSGYAMNWQLLGVASERVAKPETMPMVFETDALGLDIAANLAAVAGDRHKGGSFVCFADTHASWRSLESWGALLP